MRYPEKFDTSNLADEDRQILADFHQRRKLFDNYLTENNIALYTCPGCGFPTLSKRGSFKICSVCNWQDDNQDNENADEIWGGPNYELSLTEKRLNIGRQLRQNASDFGGEINTDPLTVLKILSFHEQKISELFKVVPGDVNLDHPITKEYEEKGQELLKQLVTTSEAHNSGLGSRWIE